MLEPIYQVKIYYTDGDSNGTYEEEMTLDMEYKDLKLATECLNRIKEHYSWVNKVTHNQSLRVPPPPAPKWWNVKAKIFKDYSYELINLPVENGKDLQMLPPWMGYFARLVAAEVIVKQEQLPSFFI